MAAKKKAKKKKSATRPKQIPAKKTTPKKSGKKRAVPKKNSARATVRSTRKVKRASSTRQSSDRRVFARQRDQKTLPESDLQGVSTAEQADSESVEELLDEGNSFEAGVVAGVERADDSDEKEVRTREFPEDDVPEEYLDEN